MGHFAQLVMTTHHPTLPSESVLTFKISILVAPPPVAVHHDIAAFSSICFGVEIANV